jgi:hypothetical protein
MRYCSTVLMGAVASAGLLLAACTSSPSPEASTSASLATALNGMTRTDFNRLAQERNLGLYWISDDGDGALEPTELATLWGLTAEPIESFVSQGAFTAKTQEIFKALQGYAGTGPAESALAPDEKARREAVRKELAQSRATVVRNDFSTFSSADKAFVAKMITIADRIEALFDKQKGTDVLRAQVPADDPSSMTLFWRNHGPECVAPATEGDAACGAIPNRPKVTSSAYPQDLLNDPKFCEKLGARKDARALMGPFVVVRGEGAALKAEPYTVAYATEMKELSDLLSQASALVVDPAEGALKSYLDAAAKAFLDNDWVPADEVWAKMGPSNSKWFVRIAPDETYFEPCSQKAGFHLTFALINQASLAWQKRLDPVKGEMEDEIARLAGKPYKARAVSFKTA